jgi:hypothetical protein
MKLLIGSVLRFHALGFTSPLTPAMLFTPLKGGRCRQGHLPICAA